MDTITLIEKLEGAAAAWSQKADSCSSLISDSHIVLAKDGRTLTTLSGKAALIPFGAESTGVWKLAAQLAALTAKEADKLFPQAAPFVAVDYREHAAKRAADIREMVAELRAVAV